MKTTKTITISLYSSNGEHIIPMLPIGYHQSLETKEVETDEIFGYHITLKIHLYGEDPKTVIQDYLKYHILPSLKKVIKETSGDDSYFDYTPDYTQQVYQLLYLTHKANLITAEELSQIQKEIQTELDAIYTEDPSDCPKYDPEEYAGYPDICSLTITEE